MLSFGVLGRSSKENERRVPIHPGHFDRVSEPLRKHLVFEEGYGEDFGVSDGAIAGRFGGVRPRRSILGDSDGVLLAKPMPEDLREFREGGVLWGWPHCVQQQEITQIAVDRKLTLLAWEAMFTWKDGVRDMHLFYRNNEMAGYCGVLHALQLAGRDGFYGAPLRAVVLSFGSVSRGAVHALRGRGAGDILVLTQRPSVMVHDRIPGCRYGQLVRGPHGVDADVGGTITPLVEVLAGADLIVNGILQNTDRPLMFLQPGEEQRLRPDSLIVDASCDEGMGFPSARPTSFRDPVFRMGPATYYAVDHTPTYLWQSASWEISRVVLAYLPGVLAGPGGWEADETLRRAIEIRDGVIQNPKIISFQGRSPDYPHAVVDSSG